MKESKMIETYYITHTSGRYELIRTIRPRFRADVDLGKPDPEIINIRWFDNDLTKEECDLSIAEALEYLEKLVLMGD